MFRRPSLYTAEQAEALLNDPVTEAVRLAQEVEDLCAVVRRLCAEIDALHSAKVSA